MGTIKLDRELKNPPFTNATDQACPACRTPYLVTHRIMTCPHCGTPTLWADCTISTEPELFRIDPAPADFAEHYKAFAAGRETIMPTRRMTTKELIEAGYIIGVDLAHDAKPVPVPKPDANTGRGKGWLLQ